MRPTGALALAASAPLASATTLYAASYAGIVSTLDLAVSNGTGSLEAVGESEGCGGSPSWLEIEEGGAIYCSDEGNTADTGGVSTLSRGESGLEQVGRLVTEQGPVSSVRFGESGLMVAQ